MCTKKCKLGEEAGLLASEMTVGKMSLNVCM